MTYLPSMPSIGFLAAVAKEAIPEPSRSFFKHFSTVWFRQLHAKDRSIRTSPGCTDDDDALFEKK